MRIRLCLVEGFLSLLAILVASSGTKAIAADVSLDWEPGASVSITGYRLYAGQCPGCYSDPIFVGNRTTYTVSGLSNGTWYFAISALFFDGTESDISNVVSYRVIAVDEPRRLFREGPDTNRVQPKYATGILPDSEENARAAGVAGRDAAAPVIGRLSSRDITGTRAAVSWITNEAADTRIDYGTTADYGQSTPLRSSLVRSHSEVLADLTENTLYHYRVLSKDAAGNLAISEDHVFATTTKAEAPIIGGVEIVEITDRSVLISWSTDKAADSQIEYRETDKAVRRSALSSFVTRHSIRLNNLKKRTRYNFRIQAADPDKGQSLSAEYSFTTLESGTWTAAIPRFMDKQANVQPGDEVSIGVALSNSGSGQAEILFTAMDSKGALIRGPDMVNPQLHRVSPQKGLLMLEDEVFGPGPGFYGTNGWIRLESSAQDLDGSLLVFDDKLSFMDGIGLGYPPLTDFIFTEIENRGSTRISIINDNDEGTDIVFELVTADGSLRGTERRGIGGKGSLAVDLHHDLFDGIVPDLKDYVRVHATQKVRPFEWTKREKGDISILAGQDASEGGTALYSPQYFWSGSMHTTLSIINLDSRSGIVELRLFGENGVQEGATRVLRIPASGKLHIEDREFFGDLGPDQILSGYVKIQSDGVRITGSTLFRHSNGMSYAAAQPLICNLQYEGLISHVASNSLFYTELAIVNPGDVDSAAVIRLYDADGLLLDERRFSIAAGGRTLQTLTDFFPSLIGKDLSRGYIRLASAEPLALFAMLDTSDESVLSAIPFLPVQ